MWIEDFYLTNYRETGGLPLRSITRLPEAEAYQLAQILSCSTTSRNNRYGDYFGTYYQKRLRTEKWLYQEVIAQGGRPETEHPIYFVLNESPRFQRFYGNL